MDRLEADANSRANTLLSPGPVHIYYFFTEISKEDASQNVSPNKAHHICYYLPQVPPSE